MAAKRYLTSMDRNFEERIDQSIHRHLEIEKKGASVRLEEYTQPTSEAFGYVFALLHASPGVDVDSGTLAGLGRRVGRPDRLRLCLRLGSMIRRKASSTLCQMRRQSALPSLTVMTNCSMLPRPAAVLSVASARQARRAPRRQGEHRCQGATEHLQMAT